MTREREAPTSSIQVLKKVSLILDCFLNQVEEAGPADIARALNINKSTAFRLLSSLEEIGLLNRSTENRGKCRLGLRLLELGLAVQDRLDLREEALPSLQRLAHQTGLTTFLCVRQRFDAVCLERIRGARVEVLALRPGGRLPLHAGAAPRVLLAAMNDAEIARYLATDKHHKFTSKTLTTPEEIRRDIRRIRQQGYALSKEDVTRGIAALGAPVRDIEGNVVGAISVAGLVAEFGDTHFQRLLDQLAEAAQGISTRIGGSVGERARQEVVAR